jgi:mannose PTS system EIIA component
MISVLVIAHEPLATALIHCTRHIYGRLPSQVAALDVIPDEDPDIALRSARDLAARINDGSGLVVLTDLFGATPARVAVQLAEPLRVMVFHGVNLPLLLKLLNYRRNVSLEDLAKKLQASIGNSIGLVTPLMAGMDEAPREPAQDAVPSDGGVPHDKIDNPGVLHEAAVGSGASDNGPGRPGSDKGTP